jgi:hypothetical protein
VEACHPYDEFNDGDSVATAIVSNNTTDVEEPAGTVKRLGAWFLLKQQFTLTTAPHHPGPHRRTPPCFPSLLLTPTFTHHRTRSYPLRRTLARTNRAARLVVGRLSAILTRATPARPPEQRRKPRATATMGFGDFSTICTKAAIPLCALVGHQEINGGAGIQTNCYSRTIEIANTLIFQAANDFMHILALIMTVVMIIHVRSKFTAVGT